LRAIHAREIKYKVKSSNFREILKALYLPMLYIKYSTQGVVSRPKNRRMKREVAMKRIEEHLE